MTLKSESPSLPPQQSDVLRRIQSYLGNGGFFNPEMMEHDKVRDLLLDVRNLLESPSLPPVEAQLWHAVNKLLIAWDNEKDDISYDLFEELIEEIRSAAAIPSPQTWQLPEQVIRGI